MKRLTVLDGQDPGAPSPARRWVLLGLPVAVGALAGDDDGSLPVPGGVFVISMPVSFGAGRVSQNGSDDAASDSS